MLSRLVHIGCVVLLGAAPLFSPVPLFAQDRPEKYALLIAVEKYQHKEMNKPALEFPEIDAKALGDVLKRSGYTVDLLLGSQAKQQSVRDKLTALKRKGNDAGVVFVGLFGHGVEYEGTESACYCPYDTSIREVKDSQGRKVFDKNGQALIEPDPTSLIEMSELLTALKLCPAGNRVLVADCCRNSPNRPRGRAFGAKLKLADVPENTAILFACSANEQAFEHKDWGHGAFTKCLLDELDSLSATGSVTMGTLAERVKPKVVSLVKSQSNGRDQQSPKFLITDSVDLQLTSRPMPLPKLLTSATTGIKLTLIPAGTFTMGSPAGEASRGDDEGPTHSVRITQPFYMGVYEVTQAEYESVMGTNPSAFSKTGTYKSDVSGMDTGKFPVETVSWEDAVEFCQKLSLKDGQTYRLPTEAEWEYACRANTTTPFHFGSTLNGDKANVDGSVPYGTTTKGKYLERTTTVGAYAKNDFGLYDMHGNVFEWCEDVYDESAYGKRSGTTSDPKVMSGSEYRVLRGGSWDLYSELARSALRLRSTPGLRNFNLGFRAVFSAFAARTP